MPKDKNIEIAKIYRHQTIDNWLFSYVIAMRRCDEEKTLKQMLLMFAKDFNLSEDEYPLESMIQKWYKMGKDYLNEEKT